jgi:hypothetical protein
MNEELRMALAETARHDAHTTWCEFTPGAPECECGYAKRYAEQQRLIGKRE